MPCICVCFYVFVSSNCVLVYVLTYVYEYFIGKEFSYNENGKFQYILSTPLRKNRQLGINGSVSWRYFSIYSRLSLSRLRLSRTTAYLEEKFWSLFKHRNLKSGNKILWIRGEIAPQEQFLPFPTIFSIYISN